MKQRHRRKENILSAVFLLCVCSALLLFMKKSEQPKEQKKQAAVPVQLATLTDRDPKAVDEALQKKKDEEKKQADAAQAKKRAEKINLDETDIWSMFHDYVMLGDSRAYGFSYYDFLREDRVFADGGSVVSSALEELDSVKAIAPKYIYLCYGLNDTGIGYWANGEEYAEELRKVFRALKETCPDAVIIASSILPGTEAAYLESPGWRKIPEFDAALKQVCEEFHETYVDNNALAEECMEEMWGPDGVHLDQEFYPLWAKNLILATLERENR